MTPRKSDIATIEVSRDQAALARAVAQHIVTRVTEAIAERGRCLLALAGGSTPLASYALLASEDFAHRIEWPRLQVFWGDERCVPPDDPRSNFRMARDALLDHVPIPARNIHRIAGESPPEQAAASYELRLRDVMGQRSGDPTAGALDLILLGMGDDGHTASLFPGGAAVHERVRWVVAVEAVGAWRISLTPVVINAARHVCFVVSGVAKAERLHEVLEGPLAPARLPAHAIRPTNGRLTWLVDEAAASRLLRRHGVA